MMDGSRGMTIGSRLLRLPSKAFETARLTAGSDALVLNWATQGIIKQNWGDKLNPWLSQRISGRRIIHRQDIVHYSGIKVHYVIGSHLGTACSQPNSIVWGAGFISASVEIPHSPQEIHAVRGWLSVERLRKAGI